MSTPHKKSNNPICTMNLQDYHRKTSLRFLYLLLPTLPVIGLFSGKFAALAFILIALVPTIFYLYEKHDSHIYQSPLAKWCIAGLIWMLISLCWTSTPLAAAGLLWIKMLLIVVGSFSMLPFLYSLTQEEKNKLFRQLLIAMAVGLLLANIEIMLNSPITREILSLEGKPINVPLIKLNTGAIVLCLLSWPTTIYLFKHYLKTWAILFYLLTLLTLMRLESQTAFLSHMVSGIIFIVIYYLKHRGLYLLFAGIFASILMAPIIAYYMDPNIVFQHIPNLEGSASEYRLFIWSFTAKRAMLEPFFGYGFDASRSIAYSSSELFHDGRPPIPLHPHNNILQIFLELGAVGLILFTGFITSCIIFIKRHAKSPLAVASYSSILSCCLLIGATGFGIWQNWLLCSYILAAMLVHIQVKDLSYDQTSH